MNASIWLMDGSIYDNVPVIAANLNVDGSPFDINTLSKIDNAFLYTLAGAKIYRQNASGTIRINVAGVTGNITLDLEQIDELVRTPA